VKSRIRLLLSVRQDNVFYCFL